MKFFLTKQNAGSMIHTATPTAQALLPMGTVTAHTDTDKAGSSSGDKAVGKPVGKPKLRTISTMLSTNGSIIPAKASRTAAQNRRQKAKA